MSDAIKITATGIDDLLKTFKTLSQKHLDIVAESLNATVDQAHKLAIRKMRQQVNFPPDYLTGDRFSIVNKATGLSLEAGIEARARSTSLRRFAGSASRLAVRKAKGATVEVKPGGSKFMEGTFFIDSLNQGNGPRSNRGLAIRLKPGQSLRNKRITAKRSTGNKNWQNVYLLYGPSVYQAFSNIIPEIEAEVQGIMRSEYLKRMEALND